MNSISGLLFFVEDLDKTIEFYEKVGFQFAERTSPDSVTGRLNWFWIEFVSKDKAEPSVFQKEIDADNGEHVGAGLFVHISVQDVDDFYDGMLARGLKPSSKPKDFPWGRREFILRDPDGYKLVFFKKL